VSTSFQWDLSQPFLYKEHTPAVAKTRCRALNNAVFLKPGEELVRLIVQWLNEGTPTQAPEPATTPRGVSTRPSLVPEGANGRHVDRTVRQLDELPESELIAAERFLTYLRATTDPVLRALLDTPTDDEPETEEEQGAVQEAREELARSEVRTLEEVRRELGL
jgi:hypothetical protein